MLVRFIREILRRGKLIRISPDVESAYRLAGLSGKKLSDEKTPVTKEEPV